MQIIFTQNNSLLSRLIRWAFNDPVSHVGFVFDNEKWLVHSNLLGVNIRVFKNWKKKQRIVYEIPYELEAAQEEEIFQSLINRVSEDEYDFSGFMYFAWRALLFKFFKKPLPAHNPWGKANMLLCTELTYMLPTWLTNIPENIDLGIVRPYRLYQILSEAKNALRNS